MIQACESSDLHAANAGLIFGAEFDRLEKTDPRRKALRNLAKTAGFALAYMAGAETVYARLVASGQSVSLAQCEAMLRSLRRTFAGYYSWQAEQLRICAILRHFESPILGRRRWCGLAPVPAEAANFPIQSGAADHVNQRLVELWRRLPNDAQIVAQVHDSVVIETPPSRVAAVIDLSREIFEAPQRLGGHTFRLPVEFTVGERWS
jgi:DNA polymerase I-like protein with 3'-5' exonuclease and polymerase domains